MGTPRTLFSRLFPQIYSLIIYLYIIGWLVNLPCEISVQYPVMSQQSLCSLTAKYDMCTYINESDNALQR